MNRLYDLLIDWLARLAARRVPNAQRLTSRWWRMNW
jgi:hypothetical protein